jgi:hypothetical protein
MRLSRGHLGWRLPQRQPQKQLSASHRGVEIAGHAGQTGYLEDIFSKGFCGCKMGLLAGGAFLVLCCWLIVVLVDL